MTVSEYISKLERSWPENVPSGLRSKAMVVVSRRIWQKRKAEWYGTDQWEHICYGGLAGYNVGLVDMDNFEALVPSSDAIHYVELGNYLIHDGALSSVTYVSRDTDSGARHISITPVADITWLK